MPLYTCLILDYLELPDELQSILKADPAFTNDCFLPVRSEWDTSWGELDRQSVLDYMKLMKHNGTFEEFVVEYGLQFEMYLIENCPLELREADEVLVNICW